MFRAPSADGPLGGDRLQIMLAFAKLENILDPEIGMSVPRSLCEQIK